MRTPAFTPARSRRVIAAATFPTAWGVAEPGDEDNLESHELAALRRFDPTPPSTESP